MNIATPLSIPCILPTMKDILLSQIASRAELVREKDESWVLHSTFKDFVDCLVSLFSRGMIKDFPACEKYVQLLAGADYHLYDSLALRQKLSINKDARTYRVTSALCAIEPGVRSEDCRQIQLMKSFLSSDDRITFPLYTLICPFFTHTATVRTSKPKSGLRDFGTHPATCFERLLFMALVSEIQSLRPIRRGLKRRRVAQPSRSSHTDQALFEGSAMESFLFGDGKSSQRLGKVLQVICRAWDLFADSLGFDDVDSMVWPYICLNASPFVHFASIPSRGDGYNPLLSMTELSFDMDLALAPEDCFPNVAAYSDQVDTCLRELSLWFLNDIREGVFNNGLYEKDYDGLPRRLKRFVDIEDSIPTRFKQFARVSLDPVRVARARLNDNGRSRPAASSALHDDGGGVLSSGAVEGNSNNNDDSSDMVIDTILEDETDTLSVVERQKLVAFHAEDQRRKQDIENSCIAEHESVTVDGVDEALSPDGTPLDRQKMASVMKDYVYMHSCSYENLVDALDNDGSSVDISGNTQFVCIDPPYNVRRMSGRDRAAYDTLFVTDMDKVIALIDELLRPGGHAVIMCSNEQFMEWKTKFETYGSHHSRQDVIASRSATRKVFNVDKTPLHFVRAPHVHASNPRRASCNLSSSVEQAVHVKKNGLPFAQEAMMVNYRTFGMVPSRFSATRNVIDNVPGLAPGEALRVPIAADVNPSESQCPPSSSSVMLRPEQKPLPLIQELVCRFSQPGDIVVDFFGGTFTTAIACFTLSDHRVFVGCELDKECFKVAADHVLTSFSVAVSDPSRKSSIKLSTEYLRSAVRIRMAGLSLKTNSQDWVAPQDCPQFQRLPQHIMTLASNATRKAHFIVQYSRKTPDLWPVSLRRIFNNIDIDHALNSEATFYGLYMAPSLIKHKNSGLGVFAGKPFSPGDVVCLYYGTLVYHDLSKRRSKRMLYGDNGVFSVDKDRFRHYALQVKTSGQSFDAVRDFKGGDRCVYIVPYRFCIGALVNDYHYDVLDGDYATYIDRSSILSNERSENVAFIQYPRPVKSASSLSDPDLVVMKATKYINRGEELYVNYDRTDFAI